jgi:hypothetical protein
MRTYFYLMSIMTNIIGSIYNSMGIFIGLMVGITIAEIFDWIAYGDGPDTVFRTILLATLSIIYAIYFIIALFSY